MDKPVDVDALLAEADWDKLFCNACNRHYSPHEAPGWCSHHVTEGLNAAQAKAEELRAKLAAAEEDAGRLAAVLADIETDRPCALGLAAWPMLRDALDAHAAHRERTK